METTLSTLEARRSALTHSFLDVTDGVRLATYEWAPPQSPKAVVQIAHGLAEHAGRYDRLAQALTRAGFAVFASDHRGHGRTARDPSELGFFASDHGFAKVVDDQYAVNRMIAARYPELPRVILGHSFGSFVTQAYLFKYASSVQAAVLSGSSSANPVETVPGLAAAHLERLRLGRHGKSKLLQQLSFGTFNDAFKPQRTDFDWLSRDPDEVDKYIADPLCGFETTVQGWIDLMSGLLYIRSSERQRALPKDLPIYLLSGAADPVGGMGKGTTRLYQQYQAAGLKRVKLELYAQARHELFNETNRDLVTDQLIAWLNGALAK